MSDEPVCAQKGPYQVNLEAGKAYFWCTCGKSQKQPYCDGAHKGTTFPPGDLARKDADGYFLFIGNKDDVMPFCDGSHNML